MMRIIKPLLVLSVFLTIFFSDKAYSFSKEEDLFASTDSSSSSYSFPINNTNENDEKEKENALELYRQFVNGKLYFQYIENGELILKSMPEKDYLRITVPFVRDSDDEIEEVPVDRYAFFDMNGDEIPELHIWSWQGYDIYTYKDEKIYHWFRSNSYAEPLNNKAILVVHPGGVNSTTYYSYFILDFYGKEALRINFFCSNMNYEKGFGGVYDETSRYFFEDVEVTLEEWNLITEKFLTVGSDKIHWYFPNENK